MPGASHSARQVQGETWPFLGCPSKASILELYSYSACSPHPSPSGQAEAAGPSPLSPLRALGVALVVQEASATIMLFS